MNKNDYKTIDTVKPNNKIDKHEQLKKRIKLAVSAMIFLPLIYFIIINFILNLHIPEKMYALLGVLYIVIFTIVIFMSLIFPHS